MVEESVREVAYLAIDPGETSGWATFDKDGEGIAMGQFRQHEEARVLTELIQEGLRAVIIEDYRNHGWKQQKRWSKNHTSKVIGKIEMLCDLAKIPYFLQPNTVKAIGYKWAGLGQAPSNHNISHQYDAYVHGVYWLRSKGILKPSVPKD